MVFHAKKAQNCNALRRDAEKQKHKDGIDKGQYFTKTEQNPPTIRNNASLIK